MLIRDNNSRHGDLMRVITTPKYLPIISDYGAYVNNQCTCTCVVHSWVIKGLKFVL